MSADPAVLINSTVSEVPTVTMRSIKTGGAAGMGNPAGLFIKYQQLVMQIDFYWAAAQRKAHYAEFTNLDF